MCIYVLDLKNDNQMIILLFSIWLLFEEQQIISDETVRQASALRKNLQTGRATKGVSSGTRWKDKS